MYFQEHGPSNTRGNLIGISANSSHAIMLEGCSKENVFWTLGLVLSISKVGQIYIDVDFVVYSRFKE